MHVFVFVFVLEMSFPACHASTQPAGSQVANAGASYGDAACQGAHVTQPRESVTPTTVSAVRVFHGGVEMLVNKRACLHRQVLIIWCFSQALRS